MPAIKAAILGFGTVGQGVYQTISTHQPKLQRALGAEVEVVAVLIHNPQKERDIAKEVLVTTDFDEILELPQLDVIFEAIVDKEPGFSYLKKALSKGCHVITANKEMFAEHGPELLHLAEKQGVNIGFEATVAGGVPIIQTLQQLLKINEVESVQGILNGTSNFILTEMREKQQTFEEALALAQEKGFAEADPTNDTAGWDAYFKLRILSSLSFGDSLGACDVEVRGISSVTAEQIRIAETLGLRFKHIAEVKEQNGQLKASVLPVLVSASHPFYQVEGVDNAVSVTTDLIGNLTLRGPGAGMLPTASAMVEDLVQIWQRPVHKSAGLQKRETGESVQQNPSHNYWLVSNLQSGSFLQEAYSYREYPGNIQVIKATEAQVKKLQQSETEVLVYPILAGLLLEGEFEEEKVEIYS